MDTLTIKIPEGKTPYVSKIIKEAGGEVVSKQEKNDIVVIDEDDEVTHGYFFGENINRVIKAFRKH
jgi:hypothetical protein